MNEEAEARALRAELELAGWMERALALERECERLLQNDEAPEPKSEG